MLEDQDLEQIRGIIRIEIHDAIDRAITNLVETILKPSFDDIYRRLDAIEARLDAIEQRLDEHDRRLERIESGMVTKNYFEERLADLRSEFRPRLHAA